MKALLILMLGLCLAEISFAQTDFRKGYIIKQSGDTLTGLVDFRESSKAYKLCDFKKSEDELVTVFKPEEITGYGFEGDKQYQSKEITVKDQPKEIVFLEILVRGTLTLYKFEKTYWIEKNSEGLQQLINETKEVYINDQRYLRNTNQHISTLNQLAFDCEKLRSKIKKVQLYEKSLTEFVENYNQCSGEPSVTFKAKKPWAKAIAGINAGMAISQLKFKDGSADGRYTYLTSSFESAKTPIFGIGLELVSPRISERFSFIVDATYMKSRHYVYNKSEVSGSTYRNYITIDLKQLKIPLGIRYTFPLRSYSPFFNLGISSTLNLSSSSTWVQEVEIDHVVTTYKREAVVINERQFGVWAGVGILRSINNKLNAFVEFRVEQTSGISENFLDLQPGLSSNIRNFQIVIGIRTR